jgi:DNA-binding NtrC family response regulator
MERNILIIDDEKVALKPYQQEIEIAGCSVEIISTSSKCKKLLENPLSIKTDKYLSLTKNVE